jgi:cold shock CspA family protein
METSYGTLTKYFGDKNFGFIRVDGLGIDCFVHVSCFVEKVAPPQNTRLKFHLVQNPRQKPGRMMALDVEVVLPKTTVVPSASEIQQ